jgi:hypothetical protein
MLKKNVIFIFLAINTAFSAVWKDGEFLLWSYDKKYFSTADFCFALRYENEKIGNPNCYEAGDWERDTIVSLYAKWLNANLDSRLKAEDLRPRNPHVIEKIRALKDRNLLFNTIKNDKVWFLLFDETAAPKEIAVFPLSLDSSKIAGKLANNWFGSTPQTKLSDSERAAKQKEPDKYFAEQPMHDFWIGIGTGWSRAKVPLTPDSWYKSMLNSRIRNYRDVKDSTSAWSFIEDSSPFYNAYIGGSIYDFIGFEFEFRRSNHKAKIDESEVIYEELSRWEFKRYELLFSLIFMTAFMPYPQIEIKPHASVSIIYSFFTEDIALKNGYGSESYNERFNFEDYYSGVALTLGLRTAFFKNYAIDLRTGIANRGTSTVNQDIIGNSTTDVFISAGLEYHFRWR